MFRITNTHVRPEPRDYTFITVIGNVGAGKSTLCRTLSETLQFDASYERVDTNPYLSDFYADQAAWGFHLQIYFLGQRYKDINTIQEMGRDHIQDRSIYEDVEIFARSLHDSGKMADRDYHTYSDLFHNMVDHLIKPDLAIYLTGSLDTILKRIALRGRESEKAVPSAYWADLHQRYERFIAGYTHSPILWVDIDRFDIYKHPEHLNMLTAEIRQFLKNRDSLAVG
ncbi:MAG TPA: deoxynucleoside kinase [Symbiobacteriaceae bacterium]|jgi:deoxyadenosine/deoxycytidine kinase|nr:deoxynucleoside kinase [Symbiobacteriaceae bacterium]